MGGLFSQWLRQQIEAWRAREGVGDRGKVDRFAKELGVAPSTVSQWLRDAATPDEYRCILLSKLTGAPLQEVRAVAGRGPRASQAPATCSAGNDVLAEIRTALGPSYNVLASLGAEDRGPLILAWAAILHKQLELRQRVRQLP